MMTSDSHAPSLLERDGGSSIPARESDWIEVREANERAFILNDTYLAVKTT